MKMRRGAALAALALAPLLTAPAQAQSGRTCEGTRVVRLADVGYENFECNCSRFSDGRWEFRSEPRVNGIRRGGPADGKLRDGD
ncbi:MAG TPA: hypothetical protein VFQ39_17880, partial [Longimicrobium sp.]|nr:hypothetical protein [Longimicrobium sp.]